MSETDKREALRVGDEAIIHTGHVYGSDHVVVITGVTKTQVKVGDKAYMKSTGKPVGTSSGKWYGGSRLHACSPDEIQRVKDKNEMAVLAERISRLAAKQPLAVLRQISALIVEPESGTQGKQP